ncbi:hypothetical protein DIPPA_07068 [Diplonema papillatum]|nr:hypothetical protein DIPPA_07068 [Diplonema papillatum]
MPAKRSRRRVDEDALDNETVIARLEIFAEGLPVDDGASIDLAQCPSTPSGEESSETSTFSSASSVGDGSDDTVSSSCCQYSEEEVESPAAGKVPSSRKSPAAAAAARVLRSNTLSQQQQQQQQQLPSQQSSLGAGAMMDLDADDAAPLAAVANPFTRFAAMSRPASRAK